MKRVILSEGKYDNILLGMLSDKFGVQRIKFFNQRECDRTAMRKDAETKYIRELFDRGSYDILVKSEVGKPNLIDVFSDIVFSRISCSRIFILVDYDGNGLEPILSKIKDKINSSRGGRLAIKESRTIVKNSILHISEIEVLIKESEKLNQFGVFYIAGFVSSLEKEAGIIKADDIDIKKRKISILVNNKNISIPLSLFFKES